MSGKSILLHNLLKYRDILFQTPHSKCVFYYSVYQPFMSDLETSFKDRIVFLQKFKTKHIKKYKDCFLVFDDFLSKLSPSFLEIFLVTTHQKNLTTIFLTQTLYFDDVLKTIRRNCHYFLFTSDLDSSSVFRVISSDLDRKSLDLFKQSFRRIMRSKDYAHVVYDRHPQTPSDLRFKYDIFARALNPSSEYMYKVFTV